MIDVSMLNKNQKEAVLAKEHYLRIVAGAGSGKTRVLTMRIAHLINDLGVKPYRILAITFTNKAANEMKERVFNMVPKDQGQPMICTVHSLCVRILREDIGALGYPKNFTIMDSDDQKTILKEAYKKFNLDQKTYSLPGMLSYISGNKTHDVSPQQALASAAIVRSQKEMAMVYEYYENRLKDLYALDFDDLILFTVRLFSTYPEVLAKWQRRYSYVHVDEFQDIDHKQYQLIRYLVGKENDLYVVGDPDQTIYTWRGADVNIIMNLKADFPETRTILLNQNYRSTSCILNGANALIHNNKNRLEKDLFTTRESEEKITHYASAGDEYEAAFVANTMKDLHAKGHAYHDMAVLYRSNYLSRAMEKALMNEGIPYIIYGGLRFYDRMEVKDALCYLRMVTSGDDLAFKRVINQPKRGIGAKTIETIQNRAFEKGCSMYDVIKEETLFSPGTQKKLDEFVEMVESWRKKNAQEDYEMFRLFEDIIQESGYKKMLEDADELDRMENLKELIDDVKQFHEDYPESTLDEYLQLVSLYGDKEEVMQSDFVQLMTVHAAKGLEFDTVFVIGMNDGIFPNDRAMNEGKKGLEEERRLAYVAFTRARNKLYITEAAGYSYIMQKERMRSRFIEELGDDYVEHQGAIYTQQKQQEEYRRANSTTSINGYVNNQEYEFQKLKTAYLQDQATPKAGGIKKGDLVTHAKFGDGVVISVEGQIAKIAFSAEFGVKKIVKNHPTLKKK